MKAYYEVVFTGGIKDSILSSIPHLIVVILLAYRGRDIEGYYIMGGILRGII